MSPPAILIVEDNPVTSKMFRLVIESEQMVAREAGTGAAALEQLKAGGIQLVVMDMVLPDMSGFELASRLRRLPGGTEIPVVALSGFSHLLDNARQRPEIFNAFLFKPVEPEHLLESVRAYLPRARSAAEVNDGQRSERILIVDDDPVQLKLARLHLGARFADVTTAGSGEAALVQARSMPPDLIVSDVLMPGMDGFELCMAVRQDPALADVPIVLASAHYADAADDELARGVGASALLKKAEFGEILSTIVEILDHREEVPAAFAAEPTERLYRDHLSRARLQLERQLALNVGQAQRAALQSAQLSILGRVANALTSCADVDAALGDVLASCLDAAGINRGVLYRTTEGGAARVSHEVGFAEVERATLENVFGHPALLSRAVADPAVLPVTAPPLDRAEADSFLVRAGVASAFFVPLVGGGRCVGALLLGSSIPNPELVQLTFCRALGAQIGLALVLADTFTSERTAREAAEEASRAKSRFLGMVSHELLTPLTSIRLQLDRLERPGREAALPDRERHIVGLISRAEQRLHDLVKILLEYTRLESGRLEVKAELVDVGELLRELIDDQQPRAQSKGLALALTTPLPEAAGGFRTDPRILRLIASNLVDNAVKFTDAGQVRVSLATEGDSLKLTVADTGRGIPPSEHGRIFDPFEQLEKAANKHTPGVGLGLALVKRLAEALGGRIELWSQVGEGSRFSLITPELAHATVEIAAPFDPG
jgi:signal transduction histidine kinase/CheY-like chemotaxis protein